MQVPAGPIYGEILNTVRNAWLDGAVTTMEEEKQLVNRLVADVPEVPSRKK
jgi:hypothetical protein